jgi:hypothetical protein
MQRDNKGRFVKKAQGGTQLWADGYEFTWGNNKYRVKAGANQAFAPVKTKYNSIEDWLGTDGLDYVESISSPKQKKPSAGMNFTSDNQSKNSNTVGGFNSINKDKLAGFLELTRAGIGAAVNNKIADRALEAEKPFLQDVSESHRSVYGDYRSQVQGEKAAAKLQNMASKPLTSDGALQQQMQLDAQIKGQEYIDQGNAKDDAMRRQTQEVAWQQNKENQQQRQAVAMQNRQAMLMTEKNKAQIENMRDSANYSQITAPLLSATEQRMRQKAVEQEYYRDYYNEALIGSNVRNNFTEGLSPKQLELKQMYNSQGITAVNDFIEKHPEYETEFSQLQTIWNREIARQTAELHGVKIDPKVLGINQSTPSGIFGSRTNLFPLHNKKGGTIYKARLTKRTKDNDRTARSIDSSKKIAARFLEKAMDSLYTYDQVELIAKPKKKRKYQAGGGLPFVGFTPVFATSEPGTPKVADTKKSKEADLTTKDILELLKDMDGLPVDESLIVSALQNFHMSKQDDPLGIMSSSDLASQYLSIIHKIKTAKFNKDEYNNAFNQLKGNGGLHEYAITSDGLLIGVNNEGNFKYFDASQVNAGKPKQTGYELLTNSNLLYLRANSPEAAFNHLLISAAQNGIGMEVITKQINEILQGLGSTKTSREGFVQMGANTVVQGIEFLQQAAKAINDPELLNTMSVEDYYQAGYITESQAAEAQQALNYIYAALPTNAQSLLLVKGGSAEGAQMILQSLVNSKVKSATTFKATPKKMEEAKGSGSGSSKGKNSGLDMSPAQLLQQGFGERSLITIQDSTSTGLQVEAVALPITNDGNKAVGAATLEDVAGSQYGGVLDFTNASMGGVMIPFEGRRNIAVDGSKLYSMNLPVDYDEYATTGNIVPDFGLIDKVNALHKQIRSQQITDVTTINQMFEEAGLPVYYNDDGTINATVYRRFGVLNGTAIDNAFGSDFVSNKYLKEIDDENVINGAISIMNQGRNKEDRVEYDAKSFFNFGGLLGDYDSVYQGTIFIPISDSVFSGIAGSGQTVTPDEANLLEAKQQQHDRVSATYINPGQLQ